MNFYWLIAFLPIFNAHIQAEPEYTTNHEIIYLLNTERTFVSHKITIDILNKYQGIESISFTEPTTNISDLELITDKTGSQIEDINGKIYIKFNDLIVGPKTEKVEFSYNSSNIFKKVGKTFVLDIPKIGGSEHIGDFNLKVYFPKSLEGLHNFQQNLRSDEKGEYLTFSKEELLGFGETLIFGDEEYYRVQVTNIISKEKNYVVVLPSIKDRQEVVIKNISKKPYKSSIDLDGNQILHYKVKIPEKIVTEYNVRVYGNSYNAKKPLKYANTKAIKNWDFTRGFPKYILSTQNKSGYDLLEPLWNVTKETLSYSTQKANYDFINRIGAENLSEDNFANAVCLEYSDLMISLLRGSNIPAREINGYALQTNRVEKPQLHSWVEYLSKEGLWTQIDPTWSDTSHQDYLNSFDLYHINFLIRGNDSEKPILPGSYKIGALEESVEVNVLEDIPIKVEVEVKKMVLGPISIFKNKSYNNIFTDVGDLPADGWKIIWRGDLKSENNLFNVNFIALTYKDFLNQSLLYLIPFFVAPVVFWLLHVNLKKIGSKKDKIKSIL